MQKPRKMKSRIILGTATLFLFSSLAYADREASDDESHISDSRIQHRSYTFPPTGEEIPYALFVPSNYNEIDSAPLIISLHGLGRSYDWLMGYNGFLDQAEAGGYVVVTPLGLSLIHISAPTRPRLSRMPSSA